MIHQFIINIRMARKAWHPLFFIINSILILALTNVFGFYEGTGATVFADESEPVVIVIDPGHGGKNLGGEYEDYTEKDMTLVVAKAMKAELEQYEGITVYLTRSDDTGLDLDKRCEFAASVDADFLFCLHFNLSEYHTLFGAETWISAFGENYSRGYEFAGIEMELLEDMGLYSRGIKTRLNDDGLDYYGIIRHATERNLPCVLIEHCHLDQENDKPFYDHKEKLEAFGRLDAEAVAKYYGLYSESLGKDFRNYQKPSVDVPAQTMGPDRTEPDICMIELVEQNTANGNVTLRVSAADYDSGMLYYAYSYDGGETFSELQRWPDKTKDTFEFTFTVPSGAIPQIIVNAYNGYDLYTESNLLSLPSVSYQTKQGEEEERSGITEDSVETSSAKVIASDGKTAIGAASLKDTEPQEVTVLYFIKVCLICVILVLGMVLSVTYILRGHRRKRRRRKRK